MEADETELARSRKTKRPAGFRRSTHNVKLLSLAERGGNIRSLLIDVDGSPLTCTYGRDGKAIVRFSDYADDSLMTSGAIKPNASLRNGRRTFTVRAADYMGNVTTTKFALIVDNKLPKLVAPGSNNTGGKPGGPGGPGGGGKGMGGGTGS